MQASKQIIVRGRVQGVFFRASAQQEAERLQVRGEVKNLGDGSVEIKAEGEAAAVQALVQWCYQGPPRAKVEEVIVTDAVFAGYQNFKVIKV